jgi:Secretion system C-terminal sorting domain
MKQRPVLLIFLCLTLYNLNVFSQAIGGTSIVKSNPSVIKISLDKGEIIFPKDFCSSNYSTVEELSPEKLPSGFNYPNLKNYHCEQPEVNYTDIIEKRVLTSTYCLIRMWSIRNTCNLSEEPVLFKQHFNTSIDASESSIATFSVDRNLSDSNIGGFYLYQNKPNPFELQTTITFKLPVSTNINLSIRDVQGKTVSQFTGFYQVGQNEIVINPETLLSSGTYYYTLTTSEFTSTRKMIVVKN